MFPEGEVRFTQWPEVAAVLVVEGLARLIATKAGRFMLFGAGVTVAILVLSPHERGR
jgi:hypothetical protein